MTPNAAGNASPQPSGGIVAGNEKAQETVVSGLRFLSPQAGSRRPTAAGRASRCFGHLLDKPQFTTLGEFGRAMDGLDVVREIAVHTEGGGRIPGFKAVQSTKSGRFYAIPTSKYAVVQDREIVQPLFDAAQQHGIETVGRIDGIGTGRTVGHVLLANPDFRVELLREYPDPIMLGVRFWNSYNLETSFGGEVFAVRMVCINYNLWGAILGRWRLTHVAHREAILGKYEGLIKNALDAAPVLTRMFEAAVNVEVAPKEVPDLLWGVGFPVRGIAEVAEAPAAWAFGDVQRLGLNAWTLYNAATAYITYRENGGTHLPATEDYSRSAVDLLTVEKDRLLAKGKERREAYVARAEADKARVARWRAEQQKATPEAK